MYALKSHLIDVLEITDDSKYNANYTAAQVMIDYATDNDLILDTASFAVTYERRFPSSLPSKAPLGANMTMYPSASKTRPPGG